MLKNSSSITSAFTSQNFFSSAIYIGLLIFVLSLPFGYTTTFLNLGLLLVLIGWGGRIISEHRFRWHRTELDLPVVLFLVLGVVACLLAPHPSSSSFGYFWKLLRAILLFYAVIHSRLGIRWRHVLITICVAAGISSALGIWYYVNDTRLALDFMGKVGIEYQEEMEDSVGFSEELRDELRKINIPLSQDAVITTTENTNEWRIKDSSRNRRYVVRKLDVDLMVYMIEHRLTGTFKMPNDLGAYLALTLPLVLGFFLTSLIGLGYEKRSKSVTVLLGILVLFMSINLALTLTRAAWVSVSISGACIFAYISVKWFSTLIAAREHIKIVMVCSAGVILVVLTLVFLPNHIMSRLQTMVQQPIGFIGERPQWWNSSLKLIHDNPITGIGLGRFRHEYKLNGPSEQYNIPFHAHNIYLNIAVEHGIPSLFLFLWILTMTCRRVWRLRSTIDFQRSYWGIAMFIGSSGFMISGLIYGLADNILHQRTVLLFWFIIGMIFYIQIQQEQENEKKLETN